MKPFDVAAIRERIELLAASEFGASPDDARQIGFHLTDWLSDLEPFVAFCSAPHSASNGEVARQIAAFLLHAPAHLAAASMLALGQPVTDDFELGAVISPSDGAR